jgi:hypothetical protein
MYKDKVDNKNVKNINVWRKSVFDIYFTEFGAVLTTVLPVLFKYCYKYCYSDTSSLFLTWSDLWTPNTTRPQALDVQWIKCRVNMEKIVSLLYNKEKASNTFFGSTVTK